MGRAKSKKEKLGELLANAVEKIRSTYVPCSTCGNVYKMERCLRQFANTVSYLEEVVGRVDASVFVNTLIHRGYYQYNGGLKRNLNYIGYYSELEIVLDGRPVAAVAVDEYVICDNGVLTLKARAHASKFYDEEVEAGYCKRLPDVGC